MNDNQFDSTKYKLGKLCKRGHDWNGTGKSLRYAINSPTCVDCARNKALAKRQQLPDYAPKNYWKPEEDLLIEQRYKLVGAEGLMPLLPGRSAMAIAKRATDMGWGMRVGRHTVNDAFFATPSILNSYWAGFIGADGCIKEATPARNPSLTITITEGDRCHLERFIKDIEFSGSIIHRSARISEKDGHQFVTKSSVSVSITSAQIFNDLQSVFNIIPRKSGVLEPPQGLDFDCSMAYIVGYLDGNGSIWMNQNKNPIMSFVGSKALLTWIQTYIQLIAPDSQSQVVKHKSIWSYATSGQYAIAVSQVMMNLNIPYLHRKLSKLTSFIESEPTRHAVTHGLALYQSFKQGSIGYTA